MSQTVIPQSMLVSFYTNWDGKTFADGTAVAVRVIDDCRVEVSLSTKANGMNKSYKTAYNVLETPTKTLSDNRIFDSYRHFSKLNECL